MSGTTRSIPNISSSGNIRPQSITTMSSPYSNTYMFLPISPTPPSGMIRRTGWGVGIRFGELAFSAGDGSEDGEVGAARRFARGGADQAPAECVSTRAFRIHGRDDIELRAHRGERRGRARLVSGRWDVRRRGQRARRTTRSGLEQGARRLTDVVEAFLLDRRRPERCRRVVHREHGRVPGAGRGIDPAGRAV